MVDSGAQLCVVPRDPKIHKKIDPGIRIKGANNKPIPVYAIHRCTFRFGEHTMRWLVLACDIDTAILGADFIDHFGIGILFHNHTYCIPGQNGQLQELAPFAARNGRQEPGISEVKWQDRAAAVEFYTNHCDDYTGEYRQILTQICEVDPINPPALSDFTDARTTPKLTREQVEETWNPRYRGYIHERFPETLLFDFSKKPKHGVEHKINLKPDAKPVRCFARRMGVNNLPMAETCVRELRKANIIEDTKQGDNEWASPIHMVPKPGGGKRLVTAFEGLNDVTIPDRHGVRHPMMMNTKLHNKRYFSSIDLKKGYHQIPIYEPHRKYTATTTPFCGTFQYRMMPMGLSNASATFQRLMDEILRDIPDTYVYLDDILIGTDTLERHDEILAQVFEKLKEYGLAVSHEKCVLGVEELTFLGYRVNAKGVTACKDKVKALRDFPTPDGPKAAARFMGMMQYHNKMIPDFQKTAIPIYKASRSATKEDFVWTDASQF